MRKIIQLLPAVVSRGYGRQLSFNHVETSQQGWLLILKISQNEKGKEK